MRISSFLYQLVKGIGGGACIALGGTTFLNIDHPIVGGLIFAVGILSIYFYDLNLYTGKVGYLIGNPPKYAVEVVLSSWVGNFIGAAAVALAMLSTSKGLTMVAKADTISQGKLALSPWSQLVLSVFCGLVVYFLVDMYRRYKNQNLVGALIYTIISVITFLICGFEHSIANIYFFTMAGRLAEGLPAILMVSFGNLLGGCLFPAASWMAKRLFPQDAK